MSLLPRCFQMFQKKWLLVCHQAHSSLVQLITPWECGAWTTGHKPILQTSWAKWVWLPGSVFSWAVFQVQLWRITFSIPRFYAGSFEYNLHRRERQHLAGSRVRSKCEFRGQVGGWTDSGNQDGHQDHLCQPRRQTPGIWRSQRHAEVGREGWGWGWWQTDVTSVLILWYSAGFMTSAAWRRFWRWKPMMPRSSASNTVNQKQVSVCVRLY